MDNSNNIKTTTFIPATQYYKLTNDNECHNGVQFQDGLVIDCIEFYAGEACAPGGIYFCAEQDIYRWLYYSRTIGLMKWMRKVTIPTDATVQNLPHMNKLKADRLILSSREPIPNHYYIKAIQDGYLHPFNYLSYVDVQTPEMCKIAVQRQVTALDYVKEQTGEICIAAVERDGYALFYVKNKTFNVCMAAVKQNGHALQFIKNQTDEICMAAVQQDGLALCYAQKQTPEICLSAVKQNGLALDLVQNQTDKICLAAVYQNGDALHYIKDPIRKLRTEQAVQKTRIVLHNAVSNHSKKSQELSNVTCDPIKDNFALVEGMLLRSGKRTGKFTSCNKHKKTKIMLDFVQ